MVQDSNNQNDEIWNQNKKMGAAPTNKCDTQTIEVSYLHSFICVPLDLDIRDTSHDVPRMPFPPATPKEPGSVDST